MAVCIGASGRLLCAQSDTSLLAQYGLNLPCRGYQRGSPTSAALLQLILILTIYLMHAVGVAFYSRCLFAGVVLAAAAATTLGVASPDDEGEMSLKALAVSNSPAMEDPLWDHSLCL
eukprot:scaffold75245_cov29-Tisochrysis_lutea.AAC.4